MTGGFENGEVSVEVVGKLRALAERDTDIPELVDFLLGHLQLDKDHAVIPVLAYFRAAFCLPLRDVLPLREWLGVKDRSEVDSKLIPAMKRTKEHWHSHQLQET